MNSMEDSLSPSPSPAPVIRSVAYAEGDPNFNTTGSAAEWSIFMSMILGDATGLVRDLAGVVKDMYRGPLDQPADPRSCGPIEARATV
jgi:hypothetical protein